MILASVLTTNLAILVLAGFVGFVVISKVPNTLHTPLMSGTNAIHGIVVLGGLLLLGLSGLDALSKALLVVAVAFGTINVVGGFLVTDRMLEMFKSRPKPRADAGIGGGGERGSTSAGEGTGAGSGASAGGGGASAGGGGASAGGGGASAGPGTSAGEGQAEPDGGPADGGRP